MMKGEREGDDRWTSERRAEELQEACRRTLDEGQRTFVALYSTPKDWAPLGGVECEMGVLASTLDALQYKIVVSATEERVRESLRTHTPDVVLFSGHASPEMGLMLEYGYGNGIPMAAGAFADAMKEAYSSGGGGRRKAPSCVALLACGTTEVAKAVSRAFPGCVVVYWATKAATIAVEQFTKEFVRAMVVEYASKKEASPGAEAIEGAFQAGVRAIQCRPGCILQDPERMWAAMYAFMYGKPPPDGTVSERVRSTLYKTVTPGARAALTAVVGVPAWRKGGGRVHEQRTDPGEDKKMLSKIVTPDVVALYEKERGSGQEEKEHRGGVQDLAAELETMRVS